MRMCVYGAASPTIDKKYIELVEKMGQEMANRGHSLVFGGGGNGLMVPHQEVKNPAEVIF